MWAEDPVAAGAFAVTNIGSFFIPVAGGAAAVGKVGSVAARAGLSTVRLGTRLDGAVSSSVVVNVGDLMARTGNTLTDLGRGSSAASRAELAGVLEAFEQTRVARNELSPPVGFGERMNAAVEQAAQLPARATEAMQHLGDRLGLHGGGGLLPAFADGVPAGGHRFDVEMPGDAPLAAAARPETTPAPNGLDSDVFNDAPSVDTGVREPVPGRDAFVDEFAEREMPKRVVESGSRGDWNRELNNPQPNTRYIVDDRFIYETDQYSRVQYAETVLTHIETMPNRNEYQQGIAGRGDRLPGDDGGHIFGAGYGAPGEGINLTAMLATLNRIGGRQYWELEQVWRGLIRAGDPVYVEVGHRFPEGGSLRPDAYVVHWRSLSGEGDSVILSNRPLTNEGGDLGR